MPHNKWIPQPFCQVNLRLFFSTHTHINWNKSLYAPSIQIFSGRRKMSVKLFVENKSTRIVIFFQASRASPPLSNTEMQSDAKYVNKTYLLRHLVSDLPIGFLSKNNTGAFKMDSNILLCRACEELTRT